MVRAFARRISPLADRWSMPVAIGIATAGAMVLAIAMAAWVGRAPGWAYDFNAYYQAASRLLATGSPYAPQTLAGPFTPIAEGMYLYSPVPAIAFIPLTALSPEAAALAWLAVRLLALAAGCALMPVSRPVRFATFGVAALSFPVLYDLNLGNVSIVVTFLTICGWRAFDRPAGGAAVALATLLRPTSAIIGLAWLVSRSWRPLAGALIVGLALIALTLPLVGLAGWIDYATLLRNVSGVTGLDKNADLGSAAIRLGLPASIAPVVFVAGAIAAVAAVVLAARRDRELGYIVAAVAGLLLVPLLWAHYLTQLLIPAAYLAGRGRRPWALILPLLAWLPVVALPFVLLAALWLPFLVVRPGPDDQRR